MKKILSLFLIFSIFLLSGCGKKSDEDILKNLEKKLDNAKSYYLEGTMEIMNNEDTYIYNVKVSYQKGDYYKIDLVNTLNNHEQVILRNDDGVYVVTPSLNKSFKFQSDWPYNNSQVYLINSILEDLREDETREFKDMSKGYSFTSSVNYPNNKSLVSQHVYVDKNNKITKTEVVDKNDDVQIRMNFEKIVFNKKFDKDYFELSNLLDINVSKKNDNTSAKNDTEDVKKNDEEVKEDANTSGDTEVKTKRTAKLDDIVYPMYLPDNTYLTSQERIDTDKGERLILTFGGDSSFVLVEEIGNYKDSGLIIPVSGEFDFLSDVIGVIGSKSLSWNSNGIEYYLTSEVLEVAELVNIANSISVLPVSK